MRTLLAILLIAGTTVAYARKGPVVRFNEPTELMSTIMYLAGITEYTECEMPDYLRDVDSAFSSMKNHAAVRTVKKIRNSGFSYDKPMAFALRLKVEGGHLLMRQGILPDKDGYLDCWDSKYEKQLLGEVDDFYRKSDFSSFYNRHKQLYFKVVTKLRKVAEKVDEQWYESFFGPRPNSSFEIIASMLNGPNNYASTIYWANGKESYYATMGSCSPDSIGNPKYYEEEILPIIIHERNHAYCNPLNREFWDDMKDKAVQVFNLHPDHYRKLAYVDPVQVMNESFVEASMIHYMRQHGYGMGELYLKYDLNERRYYLIPAMLEALKVREQQRAKYPTMHDYMPSFAKAINEAEVTPVIK